MTDRVRGVRNWTLLAVLVAAFALGGLAIAQEDQAPAIEPSIEDSEEDLGPRWMREDADGWKPGPGSGPPPWAGQDRDPNDPDDLGPRWMREDADGWTPGPGSGPPPWAGQDDGDTED